MKRLLIIPAMLLLACSKDSTGPSISVAGTWIVNWPNMSGSGLSCEMGPLTLNLTQSGGTFTGSYASGTITCTGPGGTSSGTFSGGDIAAGAIQGNTVRFDLDTADFHQSGTISGSSMMGAATWRVQSGTSVLVLSGSWSAVRQ